MLPGPFSGFLGLALLLSSAQDAPESAGAGSADRPHVRPDGGAADGHSRMVALLGELADRAYEDSPLFGTRRLHELRALLAATDDGTPPAELLQLYPVLGLEELFQGNAEAAVERLEKARALALSLPETDRPRGLARLTYNLAVACMRWGETQNCVARHTSQSCLLPIEGSGVHVEQEGSRRAIRYLLEVLAMTDGESDTHLGARWLLNLAFMTVGEYPDGVPEAHRIPPATFASDAPFPRFRDVAGDLGLDQFSPSGSVAIEDFDLDGRFDVFLTTSDPRGQTALMAADGRGGYVERVDEAGLRGITGGLHCSQADHDSDGDVDVLVLRGGWLLGHAGQEPLSLLENREPPSSSGGDAPRAGWFRDVTFESGLGEAFYPTQTADWADVDLDGDLDLFVGSEASAQSPFPSRLFRNGGDGTYTEVGREAGVANMRMAKGSSFGDVDGDGDPDLYVSNYLSPNRLYLNDGGAFRDVAVERGVEQPFDSFPCWFWDFDNDGALDLYVATYFQSTGEARLGPVVASALGLPIRQDMNKLYRGDGRGGFTEVAASKGLDLFTVVMGASFGDLDNDGWLDMYLGTGYPFYDGLVPNVMYRNRRGERFDDVTTAGGFGHLQKGHGISFADLDADGDEDVYAQMGGAYAGDAFGNALFENPGAPGNWLKLRVEGRRSNRSGVGTRVRAEIVDGEARRSVHRTVGQHGSFGNSPLELHLGIGAAERVEALEVNWPLTGETQVFRDVPAGKRARVVEGEAELVLEDVVPVPFDR